MQQEQAYPASDMNGVLVRMIALLRNLIGDVMDVNNQIDNKSHHDDQ
jgi:hypothetical protein